MWFKYGIRPLAATFSNRAKYSALNIHKAGDFPGIVIIGAQKAGTTSLFNTLATHPDIVASRLKEVHFADRNWKRGVDWYRKCFPESTENKVGLEATPNYLFHPHAARRMSSVLPTTTKFLVLIRDPVKRAVSQHSYERYRGAEHLSLESAIRSESARTDTHWDKSKENEDYWSFSLQHHSYLRRGLYAAQLDRWAACVGKDRLLVLEDTSLYNNPESEIRRICEFSGLDVTVNLPLEKSNRGTYSQKPKTNPEWYEYFREDGEALRESWGVSPTWF